MLTYYIVSALGLALQPYGVAMAWLFTYAGLLVIVISCFSFFDVYFDTKTGDYVTKFNKISLVFLVIGTLMVSEVFLFRGRAYECVDAKFEITEMEKQVNIPTDQMKVKVCRFVDQEIWNIKE